MTFWDTPKQLRDLLTDFEISGLGQSSVFRARQHVLLDDIQVDNVHGFDIIRGVPLIPQGVNEEMFRVRAFPGTCDRKLDEQMVTILFDGAVPEVQTGKILIWDAKDAFDTVFPMSVHWICDENSIQLPIKQRNDEQIHFLELFSGGYGGWSFGSRFLQANYDIPISSVSIEEDADAARQFALHHGALFVDGHRVLPVDLFQKSRGNNIVIHADIRATSWWKALAHWRVDGIAMSAPCGPWSGAAQGPGLNSVAGMLFPEALMLLRIFRPRWILIENVIGFGQHQHKQRCLDVIAACGYNIGWSKTIDSAEFGASHRQRWLAMAVRHNEAEKVSQNFQMWPCIQPQTPHTLNAIMTEALPNPSQLEVSQLMVNLAHEYILLPPGEKDKFRDATGQQVLRSRCHNEHEQHPTYMAQYGSQHDINRTQLEIKGLFAHFYIMENGKIRYLHPCEIAMMHVHWDGISVSSNIQQGWLHVGNMISIPHALLLLGNAIKIGFPERGCPQVQQMFKDLLIQSMRQNHIRQFSGKYATMFIDQRSPNSLNNWDSWLCEFDELVEKMKEGYLPAGMAWHREHGLFHLAIEAIPEIVDLPPSPITQNLALVDELSQTQPFVPMIKAKLVTSMTYASLWTPADLNREQLQDLYGNSMAISSIIPDEEGCQMILQACQDHFQIEAKQQSCCIAMILDNQLNIVQCDRETPIKTKLDLLCIDQPLFDQFGRIDDTVKPFVGQLIMEKALKPGYDGNVLFLLAAVQQSQTSIVWDANHLSLKIAVEGTSESAVQMNLDFWKSILHEDDFRALGIELHSSQIKEKGFVIMKMDQQKIPLPPIVYKFTLAVVATRAVLKQLEAGEGAQVRIKWDGHEVWNGVLHPKLNMQIVLALLHFTMLPLLEGREVRLVGMAKQLFNIDVEEVAQLFKHRPIRLHMMVEVHGGGPTKENQKVFVRNSLASTLLEQGFDIKMVSSTVDTIMQKAGMKPAAQVAHLPAGKQRLDRLLQLCRDTEIALPNKS